MKQPRLSYDRRANVADTFRSEIKANRVRALGRHTTLFHRENRYANLRANPSNLTHPSCSPCNGSTGGWYTPSPPSHLLSTQFLSLLSVLSLSLSRPLGSHSSSLSFCLQCSFQQREHVLSLTACSRCAARLRQGANGGRWVRGYKTGLARVWRIVLVGHLRRQGFIEVKKVARHRPPAAMKWTTIPQARLAPPSCFFPSAPRHRVVFADVFA